MSIFEENHIIKKLYSRDLLSQGVAIPEQHDFTNCSVTGLNGPTQSQVNSAYLGTSLEGLVTITIQGYQNIAVTKGSIIQMTAQGASGGNDDNTGGLGGIMQGTWLCDADQNIVVICGQRGADTNYYGGGGGGLSGVFLSNGSPLLVAGGGGGGGEYASSSNKNASQTITGNDGYNYGNEGNGGTIPNGGQVVDHSAGGAGLSNDGVQGDSASAFGGKCWVNGFLGGVGHESAGPGGFGGGGGSYAGGAGGGGAGGGGAGGYLSSNGSEGGGGGSYVDPGLTDSSWLGLGSLNEFGSVILVVIPVNNMSGLLVRPKLTMRL